MLASDYDRVIGDRIRSARLRRPALPPGMAAQFLCVTTDEYIAFEDGRARPTPEQVMLLADLFEVMPSQLLRP